MIRPLQPSDIPQITEIYNHYILNGVESFETEALTERQMYDRAMSVAAHCPYLVAEKDGRVAGFCYAHPWKERAAYCHTYETTVYIAPQFYRQGLGFRLMERLIGDCRSRGYRVLIACITGSNAPSIALHGRLGFTQVSCFRNVGYKFSQWLDVVDMELELGE